jgi:hypothetical protein
MDFHSDQEDFSLPRNYQPTGYIDTDKLEQANMTTHLPETNIGYRLLLKMGWSAGQGLGSDLQGKSMRFMSAANEILSVIHCGN